MLLLIIMDINREIEDIKRIDTFINFLRSYKTAFIVILLGVIAQGYHIHHVLYFISDIAGIGRFVQALVLAIFLSVGVLYFSLKLGSCHGKKIKHKYIVYINWFTVFEAFINLYY